MELLSSDFIYPFFQNGYACSKGTVRYSMDRLLTCLQEIENSTLPDMPEHEDVYLQRCDSEIVGEIQSLATTLFVGDDGNPLFEEMDRPISFPSKVG